MLDMTVSGLQDQTKKKKKKDRNLMDIVIGNPQYLIQIPPYFLSLRASTLTPLSCRTMSLYPYEEVSHQGLHTTVLQPCPRAIQLSTIIHIAGLKWAQCFRSRGQLWMTSSEWAVLCSTVWLYSWHPVKMYILISSLDFQSLMENCWVTNMQSFTHIYKPKVKDNYWVPG